MKSDKKIPLTIYLIASIIGVSFSGGILTTSNQDNITNTEIEITPIAQYPSNRTTRGLGFAMRDNYIYSIIGYNPTIIDISNISNPTFVAEYTVETGRMKTLTLRDDYLYLGSSDGLEILDISNLSNITKIGQCNTTSSVESIILQGNYAYLAARNNGLVIVNISEPTNPEKIGSYNTTIDAWDIALMGSLVYIANSNETDNALVIIDVSDPQKPIEIGNYENSEYSEMIGLSISINDSYAYLGTQEHGLFILNITDASHPNLISHFYGNTEQPIGEHGNEEIVWDTFVKEQYIFESGGSTSLYILDFSDPTNPILVGQYSESYLLYGAFVHETYLFLQDVLLGIMIFNLTFIDSQPNNLPWGLILAVTITPTLGLTLGIPIFVRYKKRKEERMIQEAKLVKQGKK